VRQARIFSLNIGISLDICIGAFFYGKMSCVLQFVVLTFWGIYAVDRELVFPKALDGIIPSWLNHVMVGEIILPVDIK